MYVNLCKKSPAVKKVCNSDEKDQVVPHKLVTQQTFTLFVLIMLDCYKLGIDKQPMFIHNFQITNIHTLLGNETDILYATNIWSQQTWNYA